MLVVEDFWKSAKLNLTKISEKSDFYILGNNDE